jgi:hypothetical protein
VTDVGRKLSFSYSTKKKTFKGEVDSAARECTSGEIEMFRAGRKGRSKRIGSAMTNDDGEFTLKKRAKPGKYFATAAESTLSTTRCLEAKSKTLRVKRPKRK